MRASERGVHREDVLERAVPSHVLVMTIGAVALIDLGADLAGLALDERARHRRAPRASLHALP